MQVYVRDNDVNGALRVFMPPVRYLEDYLELITAIEDTAADLGFPVLVEGYTPPRSYEKPSERRARQRAEAVRRYRKAMRKRFEREGY